MKRAWIGVGLAAACSGSAWAQPYTVSDVGRLPDAFSTVAWGLNNQGEVVGWCQGPLARLRAFRYTPGSGMTELAPPPGFSENRALDITDNGFIVGVATNGGVSSARIWRWKDGVYTTIPQFDGYDCSEPHVHAVNAAGEVVGYTCDPSGLTQPFYYSDATGTVDLRAYGIGSAVDINDAGVMTGSTTDGFACRWTFGIGAPEVLGALPDPYDDYSVGQGINESGEVTGYSGEIRTGIDPTRSFVLLSGEAMQEIAPPVILRSRGIAINEQGDVVGNHGTSTTVDRDAWLWTKERGTERLTPSFAGDELHSGYGDAVDINDRGQIVVRGNRLSDGDSRVLVLSPPAPSCPADLNGDGLVDFADYLEFLSLYDAEDLRIDFNQDGLVDFSDYLEFLNLYDAGC